MLSFADEGQSGKGGTAVKCGSFAGAITGKQLVCDNTPKRAQNTYKGYKFSFITFSSFPYTSLFPFYYKHGHKESYKIGCPGNDRILQGSSVLFCYKQPA